MNCEDSVFKILLISSFFQFVILGFVAFASAAPQNPEDVQILRYEVNNAGLDAYNFA